MRAERFFPIRQTRARPLACVAVAFMFGVLIERRWPLPIALPLACALPLALACYRLRRKRVLWAILLLLTALSAGMARMGLAQAAFPRVETRYSVDMSGWVASEPFTNPDTGRRIFAFELEEADGEAERLRLRVYLRGEDALLSEIAYGQRLGFKGHIWAPDPVTNPYEFDFGEYLNRQGLAAYATAKIEDVAVLGTRRDWRSALIDARGAIGRRIDALFPKHAGLMRTLVLGDRSLLSDELRDALSRTGTAHLISISGLHVTLLSAMLALLLGQVMSKRRATLVAIALLLPYGAMIGFTASFTRAILMFALLRFSPVAGRPTDGITRLCAALLIWLVIHPMSVSDAGFALSFSASAGILLLLRPLNALFGIEALHKRRPSRRRAMRWARAAVMYLPDLFTASLSAQLMTLPFVVAFFGVQSVISLPFNLVCVPLCMLGLLLGIVTLVLSVLSLPLAALLARVPDWLFACLVDVTDFSARLPVSALRVGRYPAALLALHWTIALAASELSVIDLKWRRALPFALIVVAGLSSLYTFARSWPYSVTFLDAGQADCAVVQTHGRTYLIDAGDTYTPAADYLNATCLGLDGVLLTHPHQDHAGGLTDVLQSFRPGAIYVPKGWFEVEEVAPAVSEGIDLARRMGVDIVELRAGDTVELSDAATLEVFSPAGDALPGEVNDLSILALVTCEGQRALFAGDLSQKGEPEGVPDADVLKVAHHGSSKATSERFLAACTPDIAVISVGENNYGHPAPETLEKLDAVGARVFKTRESGAIRLTWTGGGWRVKTYLEASDEVE